MRHIREEHQQTEGNPSNQLSQVAQEHPIGKPRSSMVKPKQPSTDQNVGHAKKGSKGRKAELSRSNKDRLLSDFDRKQPDEEFDLMRGEGSCDFCDTKLRESLMISHQAKQHRAQLFSCDGSCGREVSSAWKDEILDHLRRVHRLERKSDKNLIENTMNLPKNLEMISCKGVKCGRNGTFLARSVTSVERRLVRHSEKYHRAEDIKDCFVLGCRVCSWVSSLGDQQSWALHSQQVHSQPEAHHHPIKPEEIFKCNLCERESKTFLKYSGLIEHLKADHEYPEDEEKWSKVELRSQFGQMMSVPVVSAFVRQSFKALK